MSDPTYCPECQEQTTDADGDPVYDKEHPFCSDSCVERHYARRAEARAVDLADAEMGRTLPPDLHLETVEMPQW